jgi:hypothetical protein
VSARIRAARHVLALRVWCCVPVRLCILRDTVKCLERAGGSMPSVTNQTCTSMADRSCRK